jgi:hypothetical protein
MPARTLKGRPMRFLKTHFTEAEWAAGIRAAFARAPLVLALTSEKRFIS